MFNLACVLLGLLGMIYGASMEFSATMGIVYVISFWIMLRGFCQAVDG